jgi:hypothetical protein
LQLYALVVHLDRFYFEVDPDCCHVALFELVAAEPKQNICFADSAIAYDDEFDCAAVLLLLLFLGFH